MKALLADKLFLKLAAFVGLAALLYMVGIRFLLVVAVVVALVVAFPFPRLLRSITARVIASILLMTALLQLSFFIQLLVAPLSDFRVVGIVLGVLTVGILALRAGSLRLEKPPVIQKLDIFALLTALVFVLPMCVYFFGPGGLARITGFGGYQSIDGLHHFTYVTEMQLDQGLRYTPGSAYPRGFHGVTAFVQESVGLNQATASWRTNATLFVGQYIALSGLVAIVAFYLCALFYREFLGKDKAPLRLATLAIALGVSLAGFYLVMFLYQGFVSYLYVIALYVLALLFLVDCAGRDNKSPVSARWLLTGYFLCAFAVGATWPLLVPPLLLTPFAYLLPPVAQWVATVRRVLTVKNVGLALLLLAQFAPVYVQLKYGGDSGAQGINTPGSITVFHHGIFLAGLAVVAYGALSKEASERFGKFALSIFLPLFIFVSLLMALQYFTADEVRYYVIKLAMMAEVLLLALIVAWVTQLFRRARIEPLYVFVCVPVIIVLGFMTLVGPAKNPLKDARELFRQYSHFGTPAFHFEDVKKVQQLGLEGKVKKFNATVMHYNPEENKLYGNTQTSYWGNLMAYDGRYRTLYRDSKAGQCEDGFLHSLGMYHAFSGNQQNDIKRVILGCIKASRAENLDYYIITDPKSAPYLEAIFPGAVLII